MRNRIHDTSKAGAPGWPIVAAALTAFVVTVPAGAQITPGTISDLVVDSRGALVAAATVTITETNTDVSTRTKSDSDDLFLIAGVLPGSYTLRVEAGSAAQTLAVTTAGDAVQLDTMKLSF
jgi:carboxypeptidase family protein